MKGISAPPAFGSSIHNFRRSFPIGKLCSSGRYIFQSARVQLVTRGRLLDLFSNCASGAWGIVMVASDAETLRKAIETLIDAKLHDAIARPGGLQRLAAHRLTGVASFDIRNAERKLQQTLAEILTGDAVSA